MEIIEQTLSELEDLGNVISKTYDNFKKCPKVRLTRGYLTVRLQTIDEYWNQFRAGHTILLKNIKSEQRKLLPYFTQEQYSVCEDIVMQAKTDMTDLLFTIDSKVRSSPSKEGHNSSQGQQIQDPQVKLPRIEIPKFCGSYEEWPTFQDLFLSLVHRNDTISNVQKLHYLKSSITGEAEALLRHIQVIEANYVQAWETLKRRYSNKRLIVTSLLKRLFNQRKLNNQNPNHIKSLLDTTFECLNSIKNIGIQTKDWDPLIIFLVAQKLDNETHKEWEQHVSKEDEDELPALETLQKFLESKFRTLELVQQMPSTREKTVRSYHTSAITTEKTCPLCEEKHTLCHCKEFGKMEPDQRTEFVKSNFICFNCLVPGHGVKTCRLLTTCRLCRRHHHTLLHPKRALSTSGHSTRNEIQPKVLHTNVEEQSSEEVNLTVMTSQTCPARSSTVALLATALVVCKSEDGFTTVLRALIDPGSQGCFISERAAQQIKAKRQSVRGSIFGIGEVKSKIKQVVQIEVLSRSQQFSLRVKAYVISKQLTTQIPTRSISATNWSHLEGLTLADPSYNQPSNIDLLLGVNEYAQILQNYIIKGPAGSPCAQKTTLGWILFGSVDNMSSNESNLVVMHHQVEIADMLKTLWEIDIDMERKLTKTEEKCDSIYKESCTRTADGRYVVKLLFKTDKQKSVEGNTLDIARKRLELLQRRFERQLELKKCYYNVIEEYKTLNHMEEVPEEEINNKSVYLPHHAIIRSDKETTKTRVVFDASCKGINGISLNDELLTGPVLQEDLRSIIMRWRMHKICFTSDIEKMYRMILVNKEHIDFQRVLWKDNTANSDEVKHYRLLTVKFGTASAPYLAIKTLMQLADDEGHDYPIAARMLREDFYVDDVMSGCDTVQEAIEASRQLRILLERGKFKLQKWCSNNNEFLNSIREEDRSMKAQVDMKLDGIVKALGVSWNMGKDEFKYQFRLPPKKQLMTKRDILSDLQTLFDPLGWSAPVIVLAKIFVQKLWLRGVSWDDVLEDDLQDVWKSMRTELEHVNDITVPRWLETLRNSNDDISLHGFSDASSSAMAAVVYCRVAESNGKIKTNIVAARTKVTPVKPMSIPRLELCAAVLLSKLLNHAARAMRIPLDKIFAYTDSSVVLAWLHGEPNNWKQFVANRVVEILENVPNRQWHHVQSQHNPADIASRGTTSTDLKHMKLWWHGPGWLQNDIISFSQLNILPTELEKKKTKIISMNIIENENTEDKIYNFNNYDSLEELQRIIVYMRRFLNYKKGHEIKAITTQELNEALKIGIKKAQNQDFKTEIEDIEKYKRVKRNSKLKSLNPYLDDERILRVGGRLTHAELVAETKHPIILDNKNALTSLIVANSHQKTLHGGLQLMLCHIRSQFWIIRAKNIIKRHIHRCTICARVNAKARNQIMGNLPDIRVNRSRPFLYSGVDFAGPFNVLMYRGRGNKTSKAYICIFICMCVKAIHLELVGALTFDAFIGAFRRFVARRGRCAHIWSDQGRNFIGANKELIEAWKSAQLDFTGDIAQTLAMDGTQWHFNPPYSPNFGGLWEAGVKSVKLHLKKILTTNLTFEELSTILCEVESCLNSRPLTPIDDSDTDNISPLTPAHFLIGETSTSVPCPNLSKLNTNHLAKWQHTQKLLQTFWMRWQTEYLTRLQQRPKWMRQQPEFNINDVVLIKQENLAPGKWMLGRIISKHPGTDGVTRVYSVKSGTSITKRCVSKLCPLINVND